MSNTYQTKNYTAHGGAETVIGGSLRILSGASLIVDEGATVTGLEGSGAAGTAENQAESTATTIATLKDDFNALLEKLKAAGLMAADENSEAHGEQNGES